MNFYIILVALFISSTYALDPDFYMASLMDGDVPDLSPWPFAFINANPILSETFALTIMEMSQARYDAMVTRAFDFWESYGLINCVKSAEPENYVGALWGTCENANIMHIHVPLDTNGGSIYTITALNWQGTTYRPCQLEVSRKLDVLLMAVSTTSYISPSGISIPIGQAFPVGNYKTDCVKNGCNANSNFVDPIWEDYSQSVDGIGMANVFLCDVTSEDNNNGSTIGQIIGVVPLQTPGSIAGTIHVHTGAQTVYP
uniref:Uncharacterized protein n=1 Tax=Pithovirus LCPAC102 TaxID=2506587 RepID=A0A481Z516_9VIRU|nr:MAG: hypothetical protein LCPAC102_00580 [Pithovirus LCPAC102]